MMLIFRIQEIFIPPKSLRGITPSELRFLAEDQRNFHINSGMVFREMEITSDVSSCPTGTPLPHPPAKKSFAVVIARLRHRGTATGDTRYG
ncbi:hypothetical protein CEXT_440691 [Caerostris extrusa]|uniref:Uncharacterized protein n=1 Tax=Caerostris extrusa TaxID=172846 RepID=A0AAV4RCP3_CAEEX|nr:hypothetical protein CEXT_440691 [Caerostris extrusa]